MSEPDIQEPHYNDLTHGILPRRMVEQSTDLIFFHYCAPQTASIVLSNRTIRFSDISLLNDAEEAKWSAEHVFFEVLRRLRIGRGVPEKFPAVSNDFVECVERGLELARRVSRHFAACFSTDGDSLSQWRAYAADGEGFALGFTLAQKKPDIFEPMLVEYLLEQQISEMFDALAFLYDNFGDSPDRKSKPLIGALIALSNRGIAMKNPAFRDEQEIRLVTALPLSDDELPKIEIPISRQEAMQNDNVSISFEARRGLIVPYMDIPFAKTTERLVLRKVNLGPKCKSTIADVRIMLGTLGYTDIDVSVAGAAYR